MPFTPAHAAIVLPFLRMDRRYVSATALVVGSVSPDFEYFFKMGVDSHFSHTLWGILLFDVPVVIVLSIIFHDVVKANLLKNLPGFLQVRLSAMRDLDFKSHLKKYPIAFVVSAALGAGSHIFWDGFTHASGFFVRHLSFYEGTVFPFMGAKYPLYYALQYFSTWIGLTVLAIYLALMPRNNDGLYYRSSLIYWIVIFCITIIVVALRFAIKSSDYSIGNFIVTIISGLCIALIIAGLMKFRNDLAAYM
jgi:hypothetical protein